MIYTCHVVSTGMQDNCMTYSLFNFQKFDYSLNEFWPKFHIQLTLKFTISTWRTLLSYIDDTLSVHCAICY